MRNVGHFIGGKKIEGQSGRFGDFYNPSTGELQGKVALANVTEIDNAVQNAKQAQKEWALSLIHI